MRLLLLGATGFLGRYLADRLSQTMAVYVPRPRTGTTEGRVIPLANLVDAADERTIEPVLDEARPEVVVNAIAAAPTAALDVQRSVNADFPRQLGSRAAARGSRVVHISTDAVFSGARGNYSESDAPDPVDEYGRSKLAGELTAPHLTIRTSFFGRNPRGVGLVEWLVVQQGVVHGFEDYRFTGLSAVLLTELIADAIAAALEGVYHVGGEPISKHQLLVGVARQLRLDVRVTPVRRDGVDRTLDSSRFFAALGRRPPTLADSLATVTSCAASRV